MSDELDADRALDAERSHADAMAETLRLVTAWMPDDSRHVIAVRNSQVTIGMVAEGQLAVHDLKRLREADRIRPARL